MKALILAAGLGSRLQHKTADVPKAMVEVGGLPIISHQIRALQDNDINEVGVVLGYKSVILKDYLLSTHPEIIFSFFLNQRYDSSNSAYSFFMAAEFVKGDQYIHLNCDILFAHELLSQLIGSSNENVIAVSFEERLADNMELVAVDEDNKITTMDNVYFEGAVGKAFGLAKLSPESSFLILEKIKHHIAADDYNQNYYGIIRQAVKEIDYHCVDSSNLLLSEINTLSDYQRVLHKI